MLADRFKNLYAPLPDANRYLERIGMSPIEKTDKKNLDALVLAHQRNVPFENLDVYDGDLEVSIDIPALYNKIVERRRGGYCFEQNAAFMALLSALGFDCHAIAVRVVWHAACYMPISHRATVVTIDGIRYFCDVGFGGPSPQSAVLLDDFTEQKSGTNTFVFHNCEHGKVISRLVDGEKEQLLMFSETPVDPVDFLALNFYQSRSSNSGFKMVRLLNRVTETGSVTLSDNVLKIHHNGDTIEKTLNTEDELRQAIKEHFGLVVDYPLRMS